MILLLIALGTLAVLLLQYLGLPVLVDTKPSTIVLWGGVALFAALLWKMQSRRDNSYDALDMLIDERTGKASLEAHVTLVMACLAGWWIVTRTLAGVDVGERLIDVLMIFVIYRGVKRGIDAYSARAAPPEPPEVPELPAPPQVRPPAIKGGRK